MAGSGNWHDNRGMLTSAGRHRLLTRLLLGTVLGLGLVATHHLVVAHCDHASSVSVLQCDPSGADASNQWAGPDHSTTQTSMTLGFRTLTGSWDNPSPGTLFGSAALCLAIVLLTLRALSHRCLTKGTTPATGTGRAPRSASPVRQPPPDLHMLSILRT